jgi:hypothetical protein
VVSTAGEGQKIAASRFFIWGPSTPQILIGGDLVTGQLQIIVLLQCTAGRRVRIGGSAASTASLLAPDSGRFAAGRRTTRFALVPPGQDASDRFLVSLPARFFAGRLAQMAAAYDAGEIIHG